MVLSKSISKMLAAGALLVSATAASAAVYAPTFAGPDLDMGFSVTESAGFTHTVGFGTVVLSKAQNAGGGFQGRLTSLYSVDFPFGPSVPEYVARLTVDASQLGNTKFIFGVRGVVSQAVFWVDPTTVGGLTSELNDPGNYSGPLIPRVGNNFDLEIMLKNNLLTLSSNGQVLKYGVGQDQINRLFFGTENFLGEEANYTTAFVTNVSITTPDVCGIAAPCTSGTPEPGSWALMIAGFGLTGTAMRRRRVAVA
jgi:hypothetical protein